MPRVRATCDGGREGANRAERSKSDYRTSDQSTIMSARPLARVVYTLCAMLTRAGRMSDRSLISLLVIRSLGINAGQITSSCAGALMSLAVSYVNDGRVCEVRRNASSKESRQLDDVRTIVDHARQYSPLWSRSCCRRDSLERTPNAELRTGAIDSRLLYRRTENKRLLHKRSPRGENVGRK